MLTKSLFLSAFLVIIVGSAFALGWAQTSQVNQDANSVILEIKKSADEVAEKVHGQLSSQSNKLIANLEANLEAASRILQQGGEGNGKKFEDAVSKTITDVYNDLSELLSLKETASASIAKTQKSVKQGKDFINERTRQIEVEMKKHQANGALFEKNIKSLAFRYKAEINNNEPLPDEVNLAVSRLAQEIELNNQMNEIRARTLEVLQARAKDFDRYSKYAEDIRRLSEDSFFLAEGQQKVLGAIAQLRLVGIETDQIKGEMGKLTQGARDFTSNMEKSAGFISKLSRMPLLETNSEPDLTIPKIALDGKAILKKYLSEEQANKLERR